MEQESQSDRRSEKKLIDSIDEDAARKIVKWVDELDADRPARAIGRAHRHHWSRKRRVRFLRAAFVGDVEISFVVILAALSIFLAGSLGGYTWVMQIERDRLRYQMKAEAWEQLSRNLSEVRETADESAEFVRVLNRMQIELKRVSEEDQALDSQ